MSHSTLIRHGIIGAGKWAAVHIDAVRRLGNVSLAFVADTDPEKVARLKAQGLPAVMFHESLVNTGVVDTLAIVTPDATHVPLVHACLRAGVSALVEKPLGIDEDEVTAVHAAYHASQSLPSRPVRIGVNFHNRFSWPLLDLKLSLQAGALGKMLTLNVDIGTTVAQLASRTWLRTSSPLDFLGSHAADIVLWLLKPRTLTVRAWAVGSALRSQGFPCDDVYTAVLAADGGRLARITVSFVLPDTCPNATRLLLECIGSGGQATANLTDSGLLTYSNGGGHSHSNCLVRGPGSLLGPAPLPGFAQHSIAAFCDPRSLPNTRPATLCDGYNACLLLRAIEKSVTSNTDVTITLCNGGHNDL